MEQRERLEYLAKWFLADTDLKWGVAFPGDAEGQRRLLRTLMNVRMPGPVPPEVLEVQDAYLRERAREKGIVQISDIPAIASLGSTHPFAEVLSIWQGDITRLAADAVVNAANSRMLGCFVPMHTCIDNCIHTFAGVQLRAECARNMERLRETYGPEYEQPTAVPMLTDAYNLPARKVVHVVGPIVDGELTEALEQDLADCYANTLDLCLGAGLRSVAFCCISTGVFRFPNLRAAGIAAGTVTEWLGGHPGAMDRVIFNVFKEEDRRIYERELF